VTNPSENPNPVPPSGCRGSDRPTAAGAGARRPVWYRRLPGHLGIWVAGLALVAACLIGCTGFIAGAVVSDGFGGHDGGRDGRWGHEQQRGGYGRGGDEDDAPKRQQGTTAPTPVPSGTVTGTPARPSTPSPAATPTA
jgi:hypothetical protein